LSDERNEDATTEEKRPRGRPMLGAPADAGGFRRVNLSLDDTSLATAARIAPVNTSAAVRIALAYWAEHNPQKKARSKK
jgi:hypothetical protein